MEEKNHNYCVDLTGTIPSDYLQLSYRLDYIPALTPVTHAAAHIDFVPQTF